MRMRPEPAVPTVAQFDDASSVRYRRQPQRSDEHDEPLRDPTKRALHLRLRRRMKRASGPVEHRSTR